MKTKHIRQLFLGVVVWIVCHNLWVLCGTSTYYFGTAFIIAVCGWILHDIHKSVITRIFVFLSFNNIADELFFDPSAFSLNEYLTFLLFIIYSLWRNGTFSNRLNKD